MLRQWRRAIKRKLSFLKRRLVAPPRPPGEGEVLLHIGCGKINSPEFINVDAQPYAHVHIVTDDITKLDSFGDGTVDMVYMSHILEHIPRAKLMAVLQEMNRVLKIGGVLRLSVPDFDRLLEVYQAAQRDLEAIHLLLMGGHDSEYNIHHWAFNRGSLSRLLQQAGFRELRPWDPWNCRHHDFKDKACKTVTIGERSLSVSLNLEAIK